MVPVNRRHFDGGDRGGVVMKRYQLIIVAVWCILIGAASTWLVMSDQSDAAYERGRQYERADINLTLVKCADTKNIYSIPGYPQAFAPKRALKGLKIARVKDAQAAARRAGE
jgi:hypothetical protein